MKIKNIYKYYNRDNASANQRVIWKTLLFAQQQRR